MADPYGFLNVKRQNNLYRPADIRIRDYEEIEIQLPEKERQAQASRCMDCGVPFCHWGCPVSNMIPEWQDKLYHGDWEAAFHMLQETNNFPEITGRVCPAPCEGSCVLAINDDAVSIRANELAIIERAFDMGFLKPNPPTVRTGKKVAVIGSGPAGLACADQLNKARHTVVLYEAADAVGGYLRYGIPDFKLAKWVIDRRVELMQLDGLLIETEVNVGSDISIHELFEEFDAICIAIGARTPRDLAVKGRQLEGIHFAVDYLTQQNKRVAGYNFPPKQEILATDKDVIVIGGGDTGADCVGTANRQGAKSITQLEILPQPPGERIADNPWPLWPQTHRTSSSHEEGCQRIFSVATEKFNGENGHVQSLIIKDVIWETNKKGQQSMAMVDGSAREIQADLVLLAMGFTQVAKHGLIDDLGVDLTTRGTVAIDEQFMTSVEGVFSAGDATRGASLVVWAIDEGRKAAEKIDEYLSER